jgi:hypothetical protein
VAFGAGQRARAAGDGAGPTKPRGAPWTHIAGAGLLFPTMNRPFRTLPRSALKALCSGVSFSYHPTDGPRRAADPVAAPERWLHL